MKIHANALFNLHPFEWPTKKIQMKKSNLFLKKKNISVRTIESWVTLCGKYE